MTPYGTDRVRVDGERVLLSSRLPKGWRPRVERTLTSAEHPGTAVLYEDEFFEVVAIETLSAGVRYTLEPWRDHHAMRVTDRYDAESEARRLDEWRAAVSRTRKRRSAGALALLTGHLPAVVQERLGSELGLIPSRLTLMSLLSEWLVLAAVVAYAVSEVMKERPVPLWTIVAGGFLLVEMSFRFLIVWTQSRPAGSSAGAIAYILYWLMSGRSRATTPFQTMRGHAVPITATPDDVKLRDALTMKEPLATLLPTSDQWLLHERFGYDYRRAGPTVAAVFLALAIAGTITSAINHQFFTLLVAIAVAAEQAVRLSALRRGPAASVFGWIVRPLMRKFL